MFLIRSMGLPARAMSSSEPISSTDLGSMLLSDSNSVDLLRKNTVLISQVHYAIRETWMNELLDELRKFNTAVREIWDLYQASGPGQVDSQLYPPVADSTERLLALLADPVDIQASAQDVLVDDERQQLLTAVTTASRLAKRCAYDAAGLCFVTGEAGLIPRRDLIDEFLRSLQIIERVCHETP